MPSRREIREAVIQFLYCADLEGGANPSGLREPFWEFITESDRRNLQIATFRTVHHLAHGRESRLVEFVERCAPAIAHLNAWPQAEELKSHLNRLLALESSWSLAFTQLEHIPKTDNDSDVAEQFETLLEQLFKTDRDTAFYRQEFLTGAENFPAITGQLEPVSASIRRLQRISDRLRMVEEPEKFPEQVDLAKIRHSKADIAQLRLQTDQIVDSIIEKRDEIDGRIAAIVENYSPERIDPVDRAILRLGTYELLHTKTPHKAVINEAIELAKRFGTSDSKRFVNGLLDQISQTCSAPTGSSQPL
ncbi:MAG: transcription antitermination factor NusB [Armatimonadetes bacterium]|nr:transcription antitermination factor NusB [Akkermansiaceae bacterium]